MTEHFSQLDRAVRRPRLVERLLSALRQPAGILLLSGPAGFGKSSLLSEFASRAGVPLAWVSLDDEDNDPIRFWTCLISACQPAYPHLGDSVLALLRAPRVPHLLYCVDP